MILQEHNSVPGFVPRLDLNRGWGNFKDSQYRIIIKNCTPTAPTSIGGVFFPLSVPLSDDHVLVGVEGIFLQFRAHAYSLTCSSALAQVPASRLPVYLLAFPVE